MRRDVPNRAKGPLVPGPLALFPTGSRPHDELVDGIVVGVDGSQWAAQALVWAHREARLHGWPVTAVLAWGYLDQHHRDDPARFDPDYDANDALEALEAYVTRALGERRSGEVERRLVNDLAAPALLGCAKDASLLVVGARGRGGFEGLRLGSVSQQCLHHATCPVAVLRVGQNTEQEGTAVERIVVGIDGSDNARRALQWAVDEATMRDAALEVVHSWHTPAVAGYPYVAAFDPADFEEVAHATVEAALAGVDTTGLPHPIERVVRQGGAASVLLTAAKGADLVVVGSRGRGGFAELLLGSVSHQVAQHADCPVVIVPPER